MRIKFKKLSSCAAAAAATLATAAAADVVILNPAEIRGQITFGGSEQLTSFAISASSNDGFTGSKSFTSNPYSLIVESGHDYYPTVQAFFANPSVTQSYLQVSRSTAVNVNNLAGPTTIDFAYGATRRVNYSIVVSGGALTSYYVHAFASAPGESYFAQSYEWHDGQQPAASGWVTMLPAEQATVYGSISVVGADGTQVQRSLEQQAVNLLDADADVTWDIDLNDTGELSGAIDVSPAAPGRSWSVSFAGIYGTPSYGLSGTKYVGEGDAYALDLPPGDYDVALTMNFSSPSHSSRTQARRVTVAAGQVTPLDFVEALGTGQVSLSVDGSFSSAHIDWASMQLSRVEPWSSLQAYAQHYSPTGGRFDFSLADGTWKTAWLQLGLYDLSDPFLPLNVNFYRYHYDDADAPPTAVPAGATVSLGTEAVTLVKATAFFDVKEPTAGGPAIPLSSPYVYLTKFDTNPNGSTRRLTQTYAYGSPEPRALSAFALAAEPGAYSMQAFATVNGGLAQFGSKSITFSAPALTGVGTDVSVTPIESESLRVAVSFAEVVSEGLTTVVETPLGPQPPEGLAAYCGGQVAEGAECQPAYYDVQTTAQVSGATLCVRRKHAGGVGALAENLALYEYDSAQASPWRKLDDSTVADCAHDLAACGCASAASCGIDPGANPPVTAVNVCGRSVAFPSSAAQAALVASSPAAGSGLFALFEKQITNEAEFTNVVDGQVYEGPTGPPSLQAWTAPAAGTYRITATGASGASAMQAQARGVTGGCGAEISGEFTLNAGDTIEVLVGQKGTATDVSGGGGGGSFVTLNGTPLVIAGGGGGARFDALVSGRHANVNTTGVAGSKSADYTSGFIAGGDDSHGGGRAASYGAGGGGWCGDGTSDGKYGQGGFSFLSGGKGGKGKSCGAPAHGGYGGGASGNGCNGGGGGGGYSGGGGGRVAGGGGSLNAGANPVGVEGKCTPSGHGKVTVALAQ